MNTFKVIQTFVKDNSSLFEKIVLSDERKSYNDTTFYTILDYERILTLLNEYITGYSSYKINKGVNYDSGKILDKTRMFYDSIFSEPGYRRKFHLPDMPQFNKQYLMLTDDIKHAVLKLEELNEQYPDFEIKAFLTLTENQYKKLSKVYKDDMQLWLWLSYVKDCSEELKKTYRNNNTPVIHKA